MAFNWIIQYEKGGRLYTYLMTREEMTAKLMIREEMTAKITERHEIRLDLPFRVWVIIDDEIQKVTMS
jgi:hypothetical protein